MDKPVKTFKLTRIAPTPSGYLHLGNALSFVVTAALAEEYGAKILLRIDDLDQQRVNPEYVEDIFETLNFLEIPWHEGPKNLEEYKTGYSQLQRLPLYQEALTHLSSHKYIFACTCSRAQLSQSNDEGVIACACIDKSLHLSSPNTAWRLYTDMNSEITVYTLTGPVGTTLPPVMNNFAVRKKDGFPAYQLASLMDDMHFGVDLIVRGEDLWPSTLAQLYLADLLPQTENFKDATFYHHSLLLDKDAKKLSKSAGAAAVRNLRSQGKTPAGVYTLIARMLGFDAHITNWRQLGALIC